MGDDHVEKTADIQRKSHGDAAIGKLADRQYGVVAVRQLRELGLGDGAIRHRAAVGRLHRIHHGVYAVGRRQLTREGRWMAAVLAYGPGTVLSHRTAGAVWDLISAAPKIDITTCGAKRSRGRIKAHRASLDPEDVSRENGLPVTSVARTILDLSMALTEDQLTRVIEAAVRRRLYADLAELERVVTAGHRRPGLAKLRAVLAEYRDPGETKSGLERDFMHLVHRAGLPTPSVNAVVHGFEVDVYWPQWRLVVELDSRGFHTSPRAFERDRLRDTVLQKHACRVMRVTRKRLDNEPRQILEDIDALRRLAEPG